MTDTTVGTRASKKNACAHNWAFAHPQQSRRPAHKPAAAPIVFLHSERHSVQGAEPYARDDFAISRYRRSTRLFSQHPLQLLGDAIGSTPARPLRSPRCARSGWASRADFSAVNLRPDRLAGGLVGTPTPRDYRHALGVSASAESPGSSTSLQHPLRVIERQLGLARSGPELTKLECLNGTS